MVSVSDLVTHATVLNAITKCIPITIKCNCLLLIIMVTIVYIFYFFTNIILNLIFILFCKIFVLKIRKENFEHG